MSDETDRIRPELKRIPMDGVTLWKNRGNGFLVFQLHYTANPLKKSPDWRNSVRSRMTRAKFNREYEIAWESWAGKPIYGDYSAAIHGSNEPLEPEPGLPLLRGWDFGLTPACVVGQLQGSQLVIFKEFVSESMGIKRFCSEIVLPQCKVLFPYWANPDRDYLDFIDPAGLARAQTDETTCAQHMALAGIKKIFPGALDWEARRSSVEGFLTRYVRRGSEILPCFRIDNAGCPDLVSGFTGGYQYPEKVLEKEPDEIRPLKNKYSHPHDGLQYLASQVASLIRPGGKRGGDIPVQGYKFSSP